MWAGPSPYSRVQEHYAIPAILYRPVDTSNVVLIPWRPQPALIPPRSGGGRDLEELALTMPQLDPSSPRQGRVQVLSQFVRSVCSREKLAPPGLDCTCGAVLSGPAPRWQHIPSD